jgi:phosphoribosylamine--glycine ligase
MGAYSPAPVVTPEIHQRVMREVIEPTLKGMAEDGLPYTGFLYAGLMISADGVIKVLEYNCRFGDPETQPIMMRLKSDLIDLCEAALAGELENTSSDWDQRAALGIVMAAGGYPDDYLSGAVISGLPNQERGDSKVFHAATQRIDNDLVTAGGRVLCACALGQDIKEAQSKAYALANSIHWHNVYYRTDIGFKAIKD